MRTRFPEILRFVKNTRNYLPRFNTPIRYVLKNKWDLIGRIDTIFCPEEILDKYKLYVTERILEIPFVHRTLDQAVGSRILDFGCTESKLSIELASMGMEVIGVDLRPYSPYSLIHPNFTFCQGDFFDQKFGIESFDSIVAISAIEHVGLGTYGEREKEGRADYKLTRAFFEILKPEGRFILTVPFGKLNLASRYRIYDRETLHKLIDQYVVICEEYYYRNDGNVWTSISPTELEQVEWTPSIAGAEGVALICAKKTKISNGMMSRLFLRRTSNEIPVPRSRYPKCSIRILTQAFNNRNISQIRNIWSRAFLILVFFLSAIRCIPALLENMVYVHLSRSILSVFVLDTKILWRFPFDNTLVKDTWWMELEPVVICDPLRRSCLESVKGFFLGDSVGAADGFEACLLTRPSRAMLDRFFLGIAYSQNGQADRSLQVWQQTPVVAQFFLRAGSQELYEYNNPASAIEDYSMALEVDPLLCEARYRLGVSWAKLDAPDQVLRVFSEQDIASCDNYYLGEILYHRGRAFYMIGQRDQAIADLERSVALDPSDIKRWNLLGSLAAICDTSDCYLKSRELLAESIAAMPRRSDPYTRLCNFERIHKNFDRALGICNDAIMRFPVEASPYHYTGLTYLTIQDYRQAIYWLGKAAFLEPKNPTIWLRLATAYLGSSDEEKATAAYQMVLALDPENPQAIQFLTRGEKP